MVPIFLNFLDFLNEGGNLKIGDIEATRINLKKINRQEIIGILDKSLREINNSFKKFSGIHLWNDELLKSKKFLSGSSLHFFDQKIPDDIFVDKKPTVGDIDTQVNKDYAEEIKNWLDYIKNEKIGDLVFIGYKASAGQYITLWRLDKFDLNIQIDFELVEYENDMPSEWSNFSHSSSWDDIQLSIKGVFHKYILRALTSKNLRTVTILKGKKQTPKEVLTGDYAFSVALGLRKKIEPTDKQGVFREIDTKDSTYITDLREIFKILFGVYPGSDAELKQMYSFMGVLKLVKKYFTPQEIDNVILGFSLLLWDKGAQGLVRGNPKEDYETKRIAYDILLKELGRKQPKEVDDMIDTYYKNYK